MANKGLPMAYEVILLAAGQGKRMRASRNKVLLHLDKKPVLAYSLDVFLADPACQRAVIVIKEEERQLVEQVIANYFNQHHKPIELVVGGPERQDSVYQGLLAVQNQQGYVFVHDGARPFITQRLLKSVYKNLELTQAAIVGVPVKDTVKQVEKGQVVATIPRENLWAIQTPQAFICEELRAAHEKAQAEAFVGTDDASLMERYSQRQIELVLGSYDNIKLTTPEDMILGSAFMTDKIRQKEGKRP